MSETAPTLAPTPDALTRDVHYSLDSGRKAPLGTRVRRGHTYALLGITLVVYMTMAEIFGNGYKTLMIASVFCGVLSIAMFWRSERWWTAGSAAKAFWAQSPASPNERARIGCAGNARYLTTLASRGPIADVAFEPAICFAIGARPLPKRAVAAWWVISLAVAAAFVTVGLHVTARHLNGYFIFVASMAAGGIAVGWLWPTYIRVVPGRIDVLRYGFLGGRVIEAVHHDVASNPVMVDLKFRSVFIGQGDNCIEIAFGGTFDPYGFAHSVLCAAVSTTEPAPLPDDELVG